MNPPSGRCALLRAMCEGARAARASDPARLPRGSLVALRPRRALSARRFRFGRFRLRRASSAGARLRQCCDELLALLAKVFDTSQEVLSAEEAAVLVRAQTECHGTQ